MYTIVFAGEYFIPESPNAFPQLNGMIYPGRPYHWDGSELWLKYKPGFGSSRHMTCVFTTFVFMQVFNMIGAKKVWDELNICKGLVNNPMFIFIWVLIFVVQIIMTQFTQDVFKCARNGLYIV